MEIIELTDAREEKVKLEQHVINFVKTLPEARLLREFVYVKTLSELFRSMRDSGFSDEDIDTVVYNAATYASKVLKPSNNNKQASWYRE